jgi:transcription initiation factor TFIIH subunit 2
LGRTLRKEHCTWRMARPTARWSGPARLEEVPDELKEDKNTGALRLVGGKSKAALRQDRHVTADDTAVRRGVIRFMVLIVDCSENMKMRDMRPHRLDVTQQSVHAFIENYFDQNPISQLAVIELRNGTAEKITELSSNARHHKNKFEQHLAAIRYLGTGMPSMRAGLELALQLLEMQASYGTREVLMIYGALSTCDRGDIFRTVEKIKAAGVKVSIVGFMAELYVAKALAEQTGGSYSVATHAKQVRDTLLSMTTPPPEYETPDGTCG